MWLFFQITTFETNYRLEVSIELGFFKYCTMYILLKKVLEKENYFFFVQLYLTPLSCVKLTLSYFGSENIKRRAFNRKCLSCLANNGPIKSHPEVNQKKNIAGSNFFGQLN